jgi:Ser/Thr protein kinase RdoA (MazF antagonist)
MMKLSVMKGFFESKSIVTGVLDKWDHNNESIRLIRASSNFIFSFEKNNNKYILRITPQGESKKINEELSFLSFLIDNNVLVNKPIQSIEGNLVETIYSPLGIFYAVVFEFIDGKQFDIVELDESHFYLWGEALGNLHQYSKQFTQLNGMQGKYTLQETLQKSEQYLPLDETYARRELEIVKSWLGELSVTAQSYGRLHFDFELDNLIWNDKQVQIIDFESSVDGWYTADIAFALRDLFPNEVDFSDPNFQVFLEGYNSRNNLTESEIYDIPMFLRLHNVITFSSLLRTVDIESNSRNPEWLEGLITKLKTKLNDYRADFKRNNN